MNKWTKYRETTQFLAVLLLDCVARGYKKYFKKYHSGKMEIKRYGQMLGGRWMGANDLKNYERMMDEASPSELLEWSKRYRARGTDLLNFSKKISKVDFQRYNDEKIIRTLSKYVDLSARAFHFAYDYVMLNKSYSEKVTKIIFLAAGNTSAANYYLPYIAGIDDPTDIHIAQSELGKIAIFAKEKGIGKEVREKIKKYCQRYGYQQMFTYYGEPFSEDEILEKIKKLSKKDRKEIMKKTGAQVAQLRVNKKKTEEFFKKYKIAGREKQIIRVLKDYIYTSMWADEIYHRVPFLVRPLLKTFCERLKISYRQIIHMTSEEIIEALKNKQVSVGSLAKINERTQEFIFLFGDEKTKVLSGNERKKFVRKIAGKEKIFKNIKNFKELKGQPAFPGVAKGTVSVIRKLDDIKTFKQGRILVAANTAPVHVPAMERASAIITDEGGLLSHAAIVSREFKKPCIVGTKIATKVLHEGDLVEVDADMGVVKIIKSA